MWSKPAGIAVLVVGFMTAAAGGAYLATRQQPPAAFTEASPMAAPGNVAEQTPAPVQTEQSRELPTAPPAVGAQTQALTPAPAPEVRKRPTARKSVRVARPEPPVEREAPEIWGNSTVASAPVSDTAVSPAPAEPQAPQVQFQELTIPSETVIGVQVDTTVSSERARLEDRVDGRVTRDVTVGGRVAIPAGTKMLGSVTLVERGGKFKDRARIAVRFHTAQLADGSRIPLQTTAIMREGDSPSRESAAKVGGAAVGGAILGAILGGGKGAAIGGSTGAAGGTAVVMAGDRNAATLPAGTTATVRLMSDVAVTVEK